MKRFFAVCLAGGLLIGLCVYGASCGSSGSSSMPGVVTEAESLAAEPVEEMISDESKKPEDPVDEGVL